MAHGLCEKCTLELAYAIGRPEPVSIYINTYGTSSLSDEELMEIIHRNFDFSVGNMIRELDLRRPIYTSPTNYGHFGKDYLPWEQIKELK